MASYADQFRLAEAARLATGTLEASSRQLIVNAFNDWDAGYHDAQTIRHRLEAIVREAYRTAASVAYQTAIQNSGMPEWKPAVTFNTEYLQSLLEDVRRNLREYKASDRTEADRRRAVSRVQHSAGVAAQRGYTDQTIAAYAELADFGYKLRKLWIANFDNNVPCPSCVRLHGTEVGLHEAFKAESGEPGVYIDLLGPPRHPRCQCKIVMLVTTLENAGQQLDIVTPPEQPSTMSTDDVKNLPKGVLAAIRAVLKAIIRFGRKKDV